MRPIGGGTAKPKAKAPAHGYAQRQAAPNVRKAARSRGMATAAKATPRRTVKMTIQRGPKMPNLNPFDTKNVVSSAGRSVARRIEPGIGNKIMSNAGRVPGQIGQSVNDFAKGMPNPLSLPLKAGQDWFGGMGDFLKNKTR